MFPHLHDVGVLYSDKGYGSLVEIILVNPNNRFGFAVIGMYF